jgi:hypothetical protein
LNDNDIRFIKYSESDDILFIAYKNSNIDLLTDDGTIVNISDLYRKNMSGSKIINDVYFTEKATYIACDFGILVFDIDRKEFIETYIIGDNGDMTKVLNIDVKDNSIYALTTDNVLIASLSSKSFKLSKLGKINRP